MGCRERRALFLEGVIASSTGSFCEGQNIPYSIPNRKTIWVVGRMSFAMPWELNPHKAILCLFGMWVDARTTWASPSASIFLTSTLPSFCIIITQGENKSTWLWCSGRAVRLCQPRKHCPLYELENGFGASQVVLCKSTHLAHHCSVAEGAHGTNSFRSLEP